jgi:hypothetical protein
MLAAAYGKALIAVDGNIGWWFRLATQIGQV